MEPPSRLQDRSLARRIVAAPRPHAAGAARARVEDWLAEIAATPAGATLRRLLADHPALAALMTALADGSAYLWELGRADPARLAALLEGEPQRSFDEMLAAARRATAAAGDDAEVMRALRRMKADAALLIGLADIGGVWPITDVIAQQTALADAAVGATVDYLVGEAQRRGRLQGSAPARDSGYVVLAMGKMGAGELNYSSDVDLIVFYDPARLAAEAEPAPFYVRLTRRLVKLLQERTPEGYVFRTDLRLRPDPASTQIAISTGAALDY